MGAINLNYPDGWLKFFVEVDEPHIDMEVINAISAIAEGEGEDAMRTWQTLLETTYWRLSCTGCATLPFGAMISHVFVWWLRTFSAIVKS